LLGFSVFFILSLVFVAHAIRTALGAPEGTDFLSSDSEIALIEIEGPIFESDTLVKRIRRFTKGPNKALLLRLNSPGGAVAPSQEIHHEILRAREGKKIVVASMSSLGASGAYYIAAACDRIVANPGTLTGSIGVIADFPEGSALLRKVGLQFQTIKSGNLKDSGSFSRPMGPADRAYWQETIDEVFRQFLESVIQGRSTAIKEKLAQLSKRRPEQVTEREVRRHVGPYVDGRVLTGQKAFELGLVDRLGNYHEAVRLTAELAGIKGEPKVRPDRSAKFNKFLQNLAPFSSLRGGLSGVNLQYRVF
jgi:protease-4